MKAQRLTAWQKRWLHALLNAESSYVDESIFDEIREVLERCFKYDEPLPPRIRPKEKK